MTEPTSATELENFGGLGISDEAERIILQVFDEYGGEHRSTWPSGEITPRVRLLFELARSLASASEEAATAAREHASQWERRNDIEHLVRVLAHFSRDFRDLAEEWRTDHGV